MKKLDFATQGLSFSDVVITSWLCLQQGRIQEGGNRPPLKCTKVTFFTLILNNLENSIRNIWPFCRPLFCHKSVVKYTSSLLQWWTR